MNEPPTQAQANWMEAGLTRIATGAFTDGYSRQIATDALFEAGIPLKCTRCELAIFKGQPSFKGVHASCLTVMEKDA